MELTHHYMVDKKGQREIQIYIQKHNLMLQFSLCLLIHVGGTLCS